MATNQKGIDYMDNYNTRTIGMLLKEYFSETGESLETFSENAGITTGFIKQMLEDERHPSTNQKNAAIINKISAYTGDSFEDVHGAAVATKHKIELEREEQWQRDAPKRAEKERSRLEMNRYFEEQRKASELEQRIYEASLVTKTGYEITVLKEKEPIKIYGDYKLVKLGECSFIEHEGCLYGVPYITKMKEFEFKVDNEGNIVTDVDAFFFDKHKPINIK